MKIGDDDADEESRLPELQAPADQPGRLRQVDQAEPQVRYAI